MTLAEAVPLASQGFRSSALRRPASLRGGGCVLRVDSEGAARSLESLEERRLLFGFGQVYFHKVQAGVVVPSARPEWSIRLLPGEAAFAARLFDTLDVAQRVSVSRSSPVGFVRRVRLRNCGSSKLEIRVLGVSDPTAAHFGDSPASWGSLCVNAFNRDTHVAMDETSQLHPARVVGSAPGPKRLFMTSSRSKALEVLQAGEVPDATSGMSGQVIIISSHDFEIPPSGSADFALAHLYSPSKLEDVLSGFGKLSPTDTAPARRADQFSCSSRRLTTALSWARDALDGVQFEEDILDRVESLRGLCYVDRDAVDQVLSSVKGPALKGGLLPHSLSPLEPGTLETSVLLSALSRYLWLCSDRRKSRPYYGALKKAAAALSSLSAGGSLRLEGSPPQGWRRHVMSGFPSCELPEVSLSVAAALADFARVARLLGKGEDAGRFREYSELIVHSVEKKALDERGFLGANLDEAGKLHSDDTLDMVVAHYRNPSLRSAASAAVQRVLEKDFETAFGPRTVPTSNRLYFHGSYGQGQLGGFWPRAAAALASLSYSVGLPGIGSLALERLAGVVSEESLTLGGAPGEFPYWVDLDRNESHGDRSDPVAASRMLQALVEGELGLTVQGGSPAFKPPSTSACKWVLASNIWTGETVTVFVGRAGGRAFTFASCRRAEVDQGFRYAESEQPENSARGISSVSFSVPGQVVCVGSWAQSPVRASVSVPGRAPGLTKRLSTPVEEFDPDTGSWNKVGSLRVSPTMTVDVSLAPGEWKAFRISND